ncbi:MAG: hypothetical protein H6710_17960 [Myxococcales bacterium]|nr:hypothetical protein [Myxococcales bacterium]MCB9701314.1 hypothetical protein [Myxococcales bacterium]
MQLLIFFGLVVILAYAAHRWWTSEGEVTKRMLRGAAPVAIGEYPDGGCRRVDGELEILERELQAPLSGRRCAAYEIIIEESTDKDWRQVARDVKVVPFVLRDGSGRAIIKPESASLSIVADVHTCSGTFQDPGPRELALLDRLGLSARGLLFNRSLRYREGVLEPGERVAALGYGAVSADEEAGGAHHDGGYRQPGGRTKVTISGAVYLSDDPSVLSPGARLPPPADLRGRS